KNISAFERVKNYFAKDLEEIEDYDPDIHGPLVTFGGLDKHEEVERYWVNEPYAFVVILNNIERNENIYYVVEPALSGFEDIFLKEIKDRLRDVLLVEEVISNDDKNLVLTTKVKELVRDYAIELTPPLLEKILYYVIRDFTGFGYIDAIQKDDRIEDVSCNGHDVPVYLYHKQYTNIATNVVYTQDELDSFIIKLAQRSGKHISVAEPLIDATMPDGSRIQMTLSTHVTARGGTFTIRKFGDVPLTPIDLIIWKTFSSETMAYLWLCIENNKSLIFAGGTASGKTSSLNAVSLFIPRQAKVISLEDTRELKLPHPNWIPSITRDAFTADERGAVDMYDLLKAALRQRPEFLLVGEVRGKEALTLFQAMSTGHTTFSTMHADSVASAIHRLENPPISVPRSMIQALNIICIQTQTYTKGKRVRRNTKLVEIIDIDPQTRNIRTNDIFNWDSMTDTFQKVGESKAINDIMVKRAWNIQEVRRELKYREKVLEFLSRNNITDYEAVSTIIYEYSIDPEKVLNKLKIKE
ncbi:MAG: secretion system protein, partial [Methanosarcinales archaeon]|nr:secretion system protein [Methanosarcinales archaeon]